MMDDRPERQPLPSEDTGDLVDEPADGQTDDHLVASEEGVPYVPPTDRVISEARKSESGADVAGTAESDAGELEREDGVQPEDGALPRDDELQADVIEALRSSDVPAGDRIRIAVVGSVIHVRGEVESVDVLDEILGIVGDVVGVDEVVDELTVTGL
jgi:osmotically-inducible protein OsmY